MRSNYDYQDDPMMPKSGIALTIAQARASLREPSRPYTPADSLNSRSLFRGQEYGAARPSTGDCHNMGFRPETAGGSIQQGSLNQGDDYSAADREHMYTTGGAEVFNVEAAQEAEVKIPTPPPRPSKSRSMKREAKVAAKAETENRAPPAAAAEAAPSK